MATSTDARPVIRVTRKLPKTVEDRLSRTFDARLRPDDEVMTPEELARSAGDVDALLVTHTEKCSPEFIAALPDRVRMIATFSVGYDHINVPAAVARGIAVTNTPEVLTDSTADLAILLMLGAARGAYWGERMVREKTWDRWSAIEPLGVDFSGSRLGILGMGRVGQAIARRARAFDVEIHYHKRERLDGAREAGAIYHPTLEDMLPHCDFFSINCASTPETRGLIDAGMIARLPDGAILVNSARGDVVEENALLDALESGKLAAAGLDVFCNEPHIDPRFAELENVFLLPHLGSATERTREAMGMRAVDNLEAFFAGKTPGDLLKA